MNNKSFAQTVREKYGDTVNEFAFRLWAVPTTVESWEKGGTPQIQSLALLTYAYKYELAIKPEVDSKYLDMTPRELVDYLMEYFDDTENGLATRLSLSTERLSRILKRNTISNTTKRLLLEAVAHPENFLHLPKSFSK